jgi:hypothetical protein
MLAVRATEVIPRLPVVDSKAVDPKEKLRAVLAHVGRRAFEEKECDDLAR